MGSGASRGHGGRGNTSASSSAGTNGKQRAGAHQQQPGVPPPDMFEISPAAAAGGEIHTHPVVQDEDEFVDARRATLSHLLKADPQMISSQDDLRDTSSQSFGLSPHDTRVGWVRRSSVKKVEQSPKRTVLPGEFTAACVAAFRQVDKDNSGYVRSDTVWEILSSEHLGLHLSDEELEQVKQMARMTTKAGTEVCYATFVPQFAAFLRRVYRRKEVDWNDWSLVHNVESGENFYYNKRSSTVSKDEPAAYNSERIDDPLLEFIFLKDGRELTTAVTTTGDRVYVDWDTMEWKQFPAEWETQIWSPHSMSADDEHRWQEFVHPKLGLIKTYALENQRNSFVYFQESSGGWERLPLLWEVHLPFVQTMLKELARLLPGWKNVKEQVLVLRECNYNLREAISFAEINFPSTNKPKAGDEEEDESMLTMEMVQRQTHLEAELKEARAQIEELKATLAHNKKASERKLTRRMTELNISLGSAERQSQNTQAQLQGLKKQVKDQQDEIVELVRQLEEAKHRHRRDSIRLAGGETATIEEEASKQEKAPADKKQEAAPQPKTAAPSQKDQSAEALEAALKTLDQTLAEKKALAVRVTELEQRLKQPVPSEATKHAIELLQQQVNSVKASHKDATDDLREHTAEMTGLFMEAVRMTKSLHRDIGGQLEELRTKYRKELLQRKLLFNKVQELQGNIRVFVRCRHDPKSKKTDLKFPSDNEILTTTLAGEKILLEYEKVYTPDAKTVDLFDNIKQTLASALDGYNVCLMAYGQTGSGKTHTILGTPEEPGINRLALHELTTLMESKKECDYEMEISVVEIYNDKVYDLLRGKKAYESALEVHVGAQSTYVRDLLSKKIDGIEHVEEIVSDFMAVRKTASTALNFTSSRSHLVVQLTVTSYNRLSKTTTKGKVSFVDLAGSERVARSMAEGQRLVEAAAINKSLSALGLVFKSLAQKTPHVPYRNSKLTQVLQDSLGGNSKTMVIVTVHPDTAHLSETLSSLHFGMGIRDVQLGPAKQNKVKHIQAPVAL